MTYLFTQFPTAALLALFGVAGACVGRVIVWYADRLSSSLSTSEGEQPPEVARPGPIDGVPILGSLRRSGGPGRLSAGQSLTVELTTVLLFAGFVLAAVVFDCQQVTMVTPSETWRYGRVLFHLVLIGLLIAATTTDLVDYVIPDEITVTGMIVGLAGAALAGDLQMAHLWMDWNQADLVIDGQRQYGAYIPEWIKLHQHWHGLAWSAAGLVVGGGCVWLMRFASSLLLGREALGFGDVMLMGMVGSFIGWQPVCFVFLLAPLCGVTVGLAVKLFTGRTFIALGPYLSLATFLVLVSWRWLWEPTREIFGHPPSLAFLAGVAAGGLVVLLALLRLYRAIPVDR